VDWLAVHRLPICGAFIVAEGVEEGLAEGGIGGEAGWVILGVGRGRALRSVSFGGAMVAVGMAVMAVVVSGVVWFVSVRFGSGFGF
jgi:hypothetical protein